MGILGHIARGLFLAVLDVNSCIVIQQRLNDGFFKKKNSKYIAIEIQYMIFHPIFQLPMTKCLVHIKDLDGISSHRIPIWRLGGEAYPLCYSGHSYQYRS